MVKKKKPSLRRRLEIWSKQVRDRDGNEVEQREESGVERQNKAWTYIRR